MALIGRRCALGIAAGVAAVAAAAVALGPGLFVSAALHPPRRPLETLPSDLGLPYGPVAFRSRDGLPLAGWLIKPRHPRALVFLCHGHPANRCEALWPAPELYRRGFACFLFDFRAMGESGGTTSTLGAREPADLLGAMDAMQQRPDLRDLPMAAYGISMGGAVCLRVAAQDARLRAVVGHGVYTTLADAVRRRARAWAGPFGGGVARRAGAMGGPAIGQAPSAVSPLAAMARLGDRPTLLAYGAFDATAPAAEGVRLQQAASGPCDLLVLPWSTHAWVAPCDRPALARAVVWLFERVAAGRPASGAGGKRGARGDGRDDTLQKDLVAFGR